MEADSQAAAAGVRLGDRLVSANGVSLARQTHEQALRALFLSGSNALELELAHEAPPKGLLALALECSPPALPHGLGLVGGSAQPANPLDPYDVGIFIAQVHLLVYIYRNSNLHWRLKIP